MKERPNFLFIITDQHRYQGLIRVPFIWADPAAGKKGIVNSHLCGTLDLARTILNKGQRGHKGVNKGVESFVVSCWLLLKRSLTCLAPR
jgi:arylsulfatase A-like enzyme